MIYDGKNVMSLDKFTYAKAQIGDYVEQEVVDDAMDCLPPACMGPNCSQMGVSTPVRFCSFSTNR